MTGEFISEEISMFFCSEKFYGGDYIAIKQGAPEKN